MDDSVGTCACLGAEVGVDLAAQGLERRTGKLVRAPVPKITVNFDRL